MQVLAPVPDRAVEGVEQRSRGEAALGAEADQPLGVDEAEAEEVAPGPVPDLLEHARTAPDPAPDPGLVRPLGRKV